MKSITRTFTALAIVVVLAVAGVAAFYFTSAGPAHSSSSSSTSSSTSRVPYNQTLIVDETLGEPAGLDVAYDTDTPAYEIEQNTYQGLVWYQGNSTNSYEGVLATGWTISQDRMTYVFNLRHGVLFSDGHPFTAYDVWFNYYRITINNGPPGYIIGNVVLNPSRVSVDNLNSFNLTNPTASEIAVMSNPNLSIQAVDKYTIAFHLSSPLASFLARLAAPPSGILEANFVVTHGGVQANGTQNQYILAHGAPGTGPYIVSSWVHGQSITLTANPHYWGQTPHVSKVIIQYKSNTLDGINDLKGASAQMMYTVPFNLLSDIQGTPGIVLESHGLSEDIQWIGLNTQHYPLNITNVRLAIQYAINRTALIDSILHGYGVLFQGPLVQGMFGYNNSIPPIDQDLKKARAYLAAAGFPNGQGMPTLSLMYYTGDPVIAASVQVVQSDLSQIGINLNLVAVTPTEWFNVFITLPRASNFPDMIWVVWFPDFAYPDDYAYPIENINSALHENNINDTLLNQWTNQAVTEVSLTKQAQLYTQITLREKQLGLDVWLWQNKVGYGVPAFTSNVHNVYWNPILYGFNYSAIYLQSG